MSSCPILIVHEVKEKKQSKRSQDRRSISWQLTYRWRLEDATARLGGFAS